MVEEFLDMKYYMDFESYKRACSKLWLIVDEDRDGLIDFPQFNKAMILSGASFCKNSKTPENEKQMELGYMHSNEFMGDNDEKYRTMKHEADGTISKDTFMTFFFDNPPEWNTSDDE